MSEQTNTTAEQVDQARRDVRDAEAAYTKAAAARDAALVERDRQEARVRASDARTDRASRALARHPAAGLGNMTSKHVRALGRALAKNQRKHAARTYRLADVASAAKAEYERADVAAKKADGVLAAARLALCHSRPMF